MILNIHCTDQQFRCFGCIILAWICLPTKKVKIWSHSGHFAMIHHPSGWWYQSMAPLQRSAKLDTKQLANHRTIESTLSKNVLRGSLVVAKLGSCFFFFFQMFITVLCRARVSNCQDLLCECGDWGGRDDGFKGFEDVPTWSNLKYIDYWLLYFIDEFFSRLICPAVIWKTTKSLWNQKLNQEHLVCGFTESWCFWSHLKPSESPCFRPGGHLRWSLKKLGAGAKTSIISLKYRYYIGCNQSWVYNYMCIHCVYNCRNICLSYCNEYL